VDDMTLKSVLTTCTGVKGTLPAETNSIASSIWSKKVSIGRLMSCAVFILLSFSSRSEDLFWRTQCKDGCLSVLAVALYCLYSLVVLAYCMRMSVICASVLVPGEMTGLGPRFTGGINWTRLRVLYTAGRTLRNRRLRAPSPKRD